MQNLDKPSTLDFILSVTPLPILGEIKAAKTARYFSAREIAGGDEDDAFRRFAAARGLAYFIPASIIGGAYVYSQLF